MPSSISVNVCDVPPCDFTIFVGDRHGVTREAAERMLDAWLEHYDPSDRRPLYAARLRLDDAVPCSEPSTGLCAVA